MLERCCRSNSVCKTIANSYPINVLFVETTIKCNVSFQLDVTPTMHAMVFKLLPILLQYNLQTYQIMNMIGNISINTKKNLCTFIL